jgi:hypothetical protein
VGLIGVEPPSRTHVVLRTNSCRNQHVPTTHVGGRALPWTLRQRRRAVGVGESIGSIGGPYDSVRDRSGEFGVLT